MDISYFKMGTVFNMLLTIKALSITRNLPNGYVVTAGGVQEMELNAQIKYCSAKHEKYIMVSNGRWQWAGCIMADQCLKIH